ncbi:sulfatase-like hydrolase/transferase [Crateriforma spongiae]|uniref:sulfatase-like hydrolase/transferase n=1 Tax=Crateriforma spongiae TaxID=2724528 RepID=UPI0039B01918
MISIATLSRFSPHVLYRLLLISFGVFQSVAADQPNVVFILSDDQAWNDYGFMGHEHIQTPNLDALAKQGLLYERGYVTAPLCRPSLASIVTSRYPHQTGIRGNDPVMPGSNNRKNNPSMFAKLRSRMTTPLHEQPSLIRTLNENGYATLQTGKWWEGNPKDHGFTHAMTHGDESRGGRHGDKGLDIGRKTMQPIYEFVENAAENGQPFFVWYGVFLPHAPHNAPQRFFDKYKDVAPNEPTAWYWANVDWFDETCGELVNHLKSKGLYENTLFVYTCDNGWIPDPQRRDRYIRSKQEPVEAGIRTPIFLTHSSTIDPRRDSTTLASNIDIAPTILRACGITPPEEMEGLDLRDSDALRRRNRIFVEAYQHDTDLDYLDDINHGLKARVIIEGWNKLIAWSDHKQLFDLKSDPDDRNDLSNNDPQTVEELSNALKHWLTKTPMMNPE